ncbi:MAG: hypothetical protein CVU11_09105 [Bacteroidetes bacterium HGW-Bacteroidetes-6]|jgi:hypothetical protein|nr:MAG: hypothetical protein CVU11_09105 [Bacteroidetes bacterium HGW-Bacteroidetes-6]
MKRSFLTLLAFSVIISVFSQTAPTADSRVESFFGKSKINEWQQHSPDSILYYNFFVGHSFEVTNGDYLANRPEIEDAAILTLSESDAQLLTTRPYEFNILPLGLKWDENKTVYYSIENTGFYLVLHPFSYINKKFQSGK